MAEHGVVCSMTRAGHRRLDKMAVMIPLKRLTYGREASAVSLYDLCFLAGEAWDEQQGRVLG